jgi:hypothetical protein
MAKRQLTLFDEAELSSPKLRPETAEPWGPTRAPATADGAMLRVRWGLRHRDRPARHSWRAWFRALSTKVLGRTRRERERPRKPRYRGRKGSVRLIVSSRPGPTDRISIGTPTRASIRSTYARAFLGRSSKFRQPRTSSVQPGSVS